MSEGFALCPFCQSAEVSMSYSATLASPEPSCRFIECEECAGMGPSCDIIDGDDADAQRRAADAWNTRAHPSAREMSPEDVERVARALYDADHADEACPREEPLWDDNHWRHVIGETYLTLARAALQAIQGPSS